MATHDELKAYFADRLKRKVGGVVPVPKEAVSRTCALCGRDDAKLIVRNHNVLGLYNGPTVCSDLAACERRQAEHKAIRENREREAITDLASLLVTVEIPEPRGKRKESV